MLPVSVPPELTEYPTGGVSGQLGNLTLVSDPEYSHESVIVPVMGMPVMVNWLEPVPLEEMTTLVALMAKDCAAAAGGLKAAIATPRARGFVRRQSGERVS